MIFKTGFTPLESPVPLQKGFVTGRDEIDKSLIPYRKAGVKASSFLTGFTPLETIEQSVRRKMFLTGFTCLSFIICLSCNIFAQSQNLQNQESDQRISDFSLAGFGQQGKKSWDLAGKSADIFENIVRLKDVIGNLYNAEEQIRLTADKGDFNKMEGKIHLEDNVVITTSSGSKLTTDALDWDRKNQLVTTEDKVNITRENMVTQAYGAVGEPNLSKVTLQREVRVEINPKVEEGKLVDEKDKIIITCDGPLEIDYAKNIATFKNNVKVDTEDNLIFSDIMDVYFIASAGEQEKNQDERIVGIGGTKIEKIVARGNVKIIRDKNISYSDEATYTALEKKILLTGRPKLIIYSTEMEGVM